MSATGTSPWPVPIQALGPSSVATVVFRHRGAFHLTVIVKSSFQWMQGQRCQVATPEPITRADRPWEGEGARSPERASDIAPFLPRAEVRVTGHAYAPPGTMVPASSVRLGVFRDVSLVEKTIHVYGDRRSPREGPRPFQRMPLRYELAYGGPGTDNPAGVSAASGATPNLVAPDDAQRPAAFAAIGRTWPSRARHAKQIAGLDAPIYDLADDFDFSYFQAAPPDQQIDALGSDEWLLLDGMHPSAPRLSAQLPGARAEALVWAETGPSAGMRWSPPLALDTVIVDGDKHRVDLVWRGSFTLPGGDGLVPDLRAAAGLDAGQPLVWPDVEAAMLTRKRAALVLPSIEETNPEPEPLQRQETLAIMDVVGSALPFQIERAPSVPATGAAAPPSRAAPPAAGLPWDAPPMRPALSSITGGDTPLPDENTPLPALPFSRIAPETLAAADATFVGQDVESTYEALGTSSTAPPPPGDGVPAVEVPRAPPVPVVVPPPAVPSGPLGGGMSLGYEGKGFAAPAPPPLMQPPVPPARVSLPSVSSEAPIVLHDDASHAGTATIVRPTPVDEATSDRTDVRGPSRAATRFEAESTETTAPAGLAPVPPPFLAPAPVAPPLLAPAPPPPAIAPPAIAPPAIAPPAIAPPAIAPPAIAPPAIAPPAIAPPAIAPLALMPPPVTPPSLAPPAASAPPPPRASVPAAQLDDRERLRRRIEAGEDLSGEDFARQDLSGLDFQGASLVRASFAGANLRGCNLQRVKLADGKLAGADLEAADLTGADLTRADLTRARMGKAVLREAQITQATLVGADAEGADFSATKGSRVNLSRARLRGASFASADLPSADLTAAVLEGADLRGAQLADAVLDDARCDEACFDEARLVRVRGNGASLARAKLVRAVASGSSWDRAIFDGADATGCDLADAALLRTSLAGSVFRDADLRGAKLANATGDDVDFSGSRFDGADLRQARLDGAKLDGAALVKVVATKVSLGRASLTNADLKSGNFRGAKLKSADLGGASLRDTDLRDADLEDARLDGADRTGARLQGANLDGATGVDPTNA